MGRPYDERRYRKTVADFRRRGAPCWRGCGRAGVTADHVPALSLHDHQAGTGCCQLLPACPVCNFGHGARIRNRRAPTRGMATTTSRVW